MGVTGHDRREPIYEGVQVRLRTFVSEAALEPGDRLPSERELARRLAVSRTSLRQALTALRVEGLVDVRHGDGIYLLRAVDDVVPPIAAELRAAHPELPELGEVRNTLEALAAQAAAIRRTDDDLGAMVAALREMEDEIARGEPGLAGDRQFHSAVLDAARNGVLRRLLDAIVMREEELARRLMYEHLEVTGEISSEGA